MAFITLAVAVCCGVAGGVGGWLLEVHYGRRPALLAGLLAMALGIALLLAGGVLPGMEGVFYTLPGVIVVLPGAVGMLIGRLLARLLVL
ncbi:MAG: hypothetical protein ACXIU8_08985 [Alkalilacustris sp.]